jgi:hypothetical protein
MASRPTIGRPAIGAPRRRSPDAETAAPVVRVGAKRERPAAIEPEGEARAYAKVINWRLRIPGQHYSGLSNEALLEVRKREGRDFARDVPSLRAYANKRLYAAARTWAKWSETRADGVFAEAALEWVVKRVEQDGNGDVTLRPLTPAYALRKARAGKGGEPIGVFTGKWLRALKRGRVEIL